MTEDRFKKRLNAWKKSKNDNYTAEELEAESIRITAEESKKNKEKGKGSGK